jgi:hypothetical protein
MTEDVCIPDDIVLELGVDTDTGEQVDYRSNPELVNVASGVIWNAQGSTLLRRCDKGTHPNDLLPTLFEYTVKLVANGSAVVCATHSDWLYNQWADMMGWKSVNYEGLDRNACSLQWKGIMEHVEGRTRSFEMVKLSEMNIDPKIRDAVAQYGREGA